MFYIITASADSYITNKIIDNKFRATDANVGRAGTLDLFKLYDESTFISGSTKVTSSVSELSRLLVKFDYSNLQKLTSSILDINHSSFTAKLEMFEVVAGAPVPEDFNIVCYPLAQAFREGSGRNVSTFSDVDVVNFITASYSSGSPNLWNVTGSGQAGNKGQSNIDYITMGSIAGSWLDFGSSQYFEDGPGKIALDVTKVVSSSMAGLISNHGFRISFSGSDETDTKTRFVKRFASRHSKNPLVRPRLICTWNDSIQDRHLDLQFNISSSLFLKNLISGRPANLVSGSSLTQVQGPNSLMLRFVSGSGSTEKTFYVTASQHTGSTTNTGMVGVYSGTFNLTEFNTTFFGNTPKTTDKVELKEIWSSLDKKVPFYSGSIDIKKTTRTIAGFSTRRLMITPLGLQPEYKAGTEATIRFFIEDIDANSKLKAYKLPREIKTAVVDKMYYRMVDIQTGKIIVPFGKNRESTRVSMDGDGMYISFRTDGLPRNRQLTIELLVQDMGVERLMKLKNVQFRVV